MNLLATLFIGLVVGALAKLLMPGRDPGGIVITILLGIAGAFVGTYIGRALRLYGPDASAGFLMSVVGLLAQHPNPTPEQIEEGIAGNLCRCTGYASIRRSVQRAVELSRR